jgi:hypothetical protein
VKRTSRRRRLSTTPLLLILLIAASCRATEGYSVQRKRLESAASDLSSGVLEGVEKKVDRLLVETAAKEAEHVLQRFHAASLASEAHALASFGDTFRGGRGSGGELFQTSAHTDPITGHLVAVGFYAQHALKWSARAAKARPVVDGVELLPPTLASSSVEQCGKRVSYLVIYALARLRFEDRLASLFDGEKRLAVFETVKEEMESTGVPKPARPWVNLALFDWSKDTDEGTAFKHAVEMLLEVEMLHGGDDSLNAEVRRLEEWLTGNGQYEFVCTKCSHVVALPIAVRCQVCQEVPTIEFQMKPKPDQPR